LTFGIDVMHRPVEGKDVAQTLLMKSLAPLICARSPVTLKSEIELSLAYIKGKRETLIHNLKKNKCGGMEKEIRGMLLRLNDETMSKATLIDNPHFFRGYIMALHEVLGEGVDQEKYFGIFMGKQDESPDAKEQWRRRFEEAALKAQHSRAAIKTLPCARASR
jgi:hypothetical protein